MTYVRLLSYVAYGTTLFHTYCLKDMNMNRIRHKNIRGFKGYAVHLILFME